MGFGRGCYILLRQRRCFKLCFLGCKLILYNLVIKYELYKRNNDVFCRDYLGVLLKSKRYPWWFFLFMMLGFNSEDIALGKLLLIVSGQRFSVPLIFEERLKF